MGKISINLSAGNLVKSEPVVGIDLGTTNSLIAWVDPVSKLPKCIPDLSGSLSTPSLVYFDPAGQVEVGALVRQFISTNPASVVYSVKRLMGVNRSDLESSPDFFKFSYPIRISPQTGEVEVALGPDGYSPAQVSAEILKVLKVQAERQLRQEVNKTVITVPAYFNDAQRQATREAGRLAGFDVLRIINEPTAASLAYGIGLQGSGTRRVAVYDLGGGTFDISILEITDGIFEVLSTHGDTQLGGDDFDRCIINFWRACYSLTEDFAHTHQGQLRVLAEQAKCALSDLPHFTGRIDDLSFELSRSKFEWLIESLIDRTLDACKLALKDAGCDVGTIDEVILVGGATRVPAVISQVSGFFNRPVHHSLDPDQVVALGAAIQADILAGNSRQLLLLDVTPLSLGIETAGGLMDVLIPRNSKVPTQASRQYTTQKDGQTGIRISIYQGERDLVSGNRELGAFHLRGIPAMPAGLPKVQVLFQVDADGILKVSAKELRSGLEQSIRINDKLGLDDTIVEKMIDDSIKNAADDISSRKWAELKVEAQQRIDQAESFLSKNRDHLLDTEFDEISKCVELIKFQLGVSQVTDLQDSIDALDRVARPPAERIMDISIAAALKGRSITGEDA